MQSFKGLRVVIVLLMMLQNTSYVYSFPANPCDATLTNPCIVQDSKASSSSAVWLRNARMILNSYTGNTLGVEQLYISASEEPSEKGWRDVAQYIERHREPDHPVFVLDLRQESHGYINGKAVTLSSSHNWTNAGKTNEESATAEIQWLNQLRARKNVSGVLTPLQYNAKDFTHGKKLSIKAVHNEEYFVKKWGFNYHRLYITDHCAPMDSEVDAFLALIKTHSDKTWFHVHCRAGKGRTTTFLVMYDIIKNADKVTFNEIIERQASIPPFYNLLNTQRGDPELVSYYEERAVFLHKFYEFSQQSLSGYEGTWSDWRRLNPF